MSSEERRKILQMVEEGKISAEQAANLMRALDADTDQVEAEIEVFETGADIGGERIDAPEFEEVKSRARRFAMIPLWIGVFLSVLSAWGIYSVQQSVGVNFWSFCLMVPLLLGVLLIALGAGGQNSKWLYVNVDRRQAHDWPQNITLGFPLPLGLTAWFLRTFGHNIRGMRKTNVDEIIQILDATGKSGAPLIINANDNEDGEHVQVYIG
jgi:cytochrome bd-type quinol oxidase subunit 1